MLDLSIIIVNWNGKDLLTKCLQCVESTVKKISYETFVVDNASTDGSQDMVRRDFPNVKLMANTDNVGFAKANNQAMKIAVGRYVLLLNSDAFVKENTLDAMVAFMDEHPDAGMASCKLFYEEGQLQLSCTSFPTLRTELYITLGLPKLFPKSHEFGRYFYEDWDYNSVRSDIDVILGAFMLARKTAIDAVGMMDESYFMYSEEVDWCYRFKKKGWKIYFEPKVEAIHLWGGTSKQVKIQMLIQLYRSRIKFFRENYSWLSGQLLKVILGVYCVSRIVPWGLSNRLKPNSNLKQKQQAFQALLKALPGL